MAVVILPTKVYNLLYNLISYRKRKLQEINEPTKSVTTSVNRQWQRKVKESQARK